MDLNDYAHGLLPLYFIESAYESYKNFLKIGFGFVENQGIIL